MLRAEEPFSLMDEEREESREKEGSLRTGRRGEVFDLRGKGRRDPLFRFFEDGFSTIFISHLPPS